MVLFDHDPVGNITGVTDGRGHTTTTTYDSVFQTFPETVTPPTVNGVSLQTNASYDARWGVVDIAADANGQQTDYDYDGLGRLTDVTDPLGTVTHYAYTDGPTGRTVETTLAHGSVMLQGLSYQYDAVGNITNLDDTVTGRTWLYGYDPFDRLIWAERVPDSLLYDFAYDRLHNLTYRYDPVANIGWELIYPNDPTAPRPHAPLAVTDGSQPLAAFDYDANGNRAADTQRGISYEFDIENRLIQVTGPDETSFAYDGNDRRVSRTVGSGSEAETTLYVGEHYETSAGDSWSAPQTIFGDSGNHQWLPQLAGDAAGTLYLVWVEGVEVSGQSHGYEAQLHFSIRNPLTGGWLPPETIPTTVQQLFGPSEEIPGITVAPNGQVFVAWEEFVGNNYNIRVYRRDLNGNWALDEAFDQLSADEINPSLAAAPNGEIYLAWQNEGDGTIQVRRRDSAGVWNSEPTIPQQSGQAARLPALAGDSQGNVYLAHQQGSVLKVTRRDTSGNWTLDPNLGDPSSSTASAAMAVAVDGTDRLYVAWESSNTRYSLERRNPDGVWATVDEGIMYESLDVTTDSLNQPHVISDDPNDTSLDDLQLYVDGEGLLPRPRATILGPFYPTIGVGEEDNLVAIWQAHPTDKFEDPARLYLSVNQPQVTKHYYLNPGQQLATRVNDTLYYIHTDHLGSTTLVTDDSGNEVSRVHYSPYGSIIEQSGDLPTDRLFTGQRLEASLDLYDYRARMYDPLVGSFLSPDSLVPQPSNPVDWNRFAYVRGNPVRYSDPSGHCVEAECLFFQKDYTRMLIVGFGGYAATVTAIELADELDVSVPPFPGRGPNMPPLPGYGEGEFQLRDPMRIPGVMLGEGIEHLRGAFITVLGDEPRTIGLEFPTESGVPPFVVLTASDYRQTFFNAYPHLEGKVWVHHAVEQQVLNRYPGLFTEEEIHSLDNLRGIPTGINSLLHLSLIRKAWNRFYQQHPNPTKSEVLQKASEIDDIFGKYFDPPVR